MRKPHLFALVVLTPLLLGLAYAQEVAPVAPDVAGWFASTAALAVVVAAVVAFLKQHVFKDADGIVVIIISLVTGAAFGVGGHLLGYVEGGLVAGLGFGLSAGLLASGGWDAISGLLGKRQAAQ